MNSSIKFLLPAIVLFLLASGYGYFSLTSGEPESIADNLKGTEVTMYSGPDCQCCFKWGDYMEARGFEVEEIKDADLLAMKNELEIPRDLRSCHTAKIGAYYVEGHVPSEAIEELLTNQPDIKGIAVAGSTVGTPGMGHPNAGPYNVYQIDHEGERSVFSTHEPVAE